MLLIWKGIFVHSSHPPHEISSLKQFQHFFFLIILYSHWTEEQKDFDKIQWDESYKAKGMSSADFGGDITNVIMIEWIF